MNKLDKIVKEFLAEKKNKSKLCKKGQAYRKRRMAAGEKSVVRLVWLQPNPAEDPF